MGNGRFRLFILGAGFSRPAGLPLASELWEEVRRRASSLGGRAGKFRADLECYIEYRRKCDGKELSEDQVDFEDFMRFLDVEHFLGLRGSDTWSPDGNEGTVIAKFLIGKILAERCPSPDSIPSLYLDFAVGLQPHDVVLTFNYDVLLERALDVVNKPYRLYPYRFGSVSQRPVTGDDTEREVVILKLHGSVDWLDRASYTDIEQTCLRDGLIGPRHPVFSRPERFNVAKLVDNPRSADNPLDQIYRVRDIEALYSKNLMFRATPWLLAPSAAKILYARTLGEFWYGLGRAGALSLGLAIVGYSLPHQDEYARQVVYAIATNYQDENWNGELLGRKKSPLVVVDYCKEDESLKEFERRYSFVDWDRAVLHREGLDEKAVALMLNGP